MAKYLFAILILSSVTLLASADEGMFHIEVPESPSECWEQLLESAKHQTFFSVFKDTALAKCSMPHVSELIKDETLKVALHLLRYGAALDDVKAFINGLYKGIQKDYQIASPCVRGVTDTS
jgi:hypothetical protein